MCNWKPLEPIASVSDVIFAKVVAISGRLVTILLSLFQGGTVVRKSCLTKWSEETPGKRSRFDSSLTVEEKGNCVTCAAKICTAWSRERACCLLIAQVDCVLYILVVNRCVFVLIYHNPVCVFVLWLLLKDVCNSYCFQKYFLLVIFVSRLFSTKAHNEK